MYVSVAYTACQEKLMRIIDIETVSKLVAWKDSC